MGKSALNYTVEVKPGGIHYLGTYNYVPKKASNMFSPGTFELQPDQSKASHAEILTWMEEVTGETRWHTAVQKRLSHIVKGLPKKK